MCISPLAIFKRPYIQEKLWKIEKLKQNTEAFRKLLMQLLLRHIKHAEKN
jgi:hypothetical protein